MHDFVSLVDTLQRYANDYPEKLAIKFLTQKGYETLTYRELDLRVQTMAHILQQKESYLGQRAIILLPPGLDYVVAFLACLYARVIAVPVYPPRKNQHASRVFSIIENSEAAFVITHSLLSAQFSASHVIDIDTVDKKLVRACVPQAVTPNTIAFIQYTSGSTSAPKGVLITHRNIISNIQVIQSIFPGGDGHKVCSWLPPYHDMGLIGGILCSLYIKTELILMSPTYFLQSPIRWLEMISEERVSMTVAPNFAFELCSKKVKPEQLQKLDLSCLQCVYNGSEPIQLASIQRFYDTFSPVGFSLSALYSCYGLAEATLMLTVKQWNDVDHSLSLIKSDFELGKVSIATDSDHHTVSIVNCGHCQPNHSVRIVHPGTLEDVPERVIGEIWASGPSISEGYWRQHELTEAVFGKQLSNTAGGRYLRTQDLGFIHQGDLYVTGRMNDLMVIHGKNYYPHDIEQLAVNCHPACEFQGAAAFSIEKAGETQLVLLQEIKRDAIRHLEPDLLCSTLRGMLIDNGLVPYSIVLLKPYTLPKTSSGKIRRGAARVAFLENELQVLARWDRNNSLGHPSAPTRFSFDNIKEWLDNWLSQHLKMFLVHEDYEKSLVELGINSIAAVELSNDLQNKLGKQIELLPLFEQYSLHQLIANLSDESSTPLTKPDFGLPYPEDGFISNLKSIYLNVNEGISSNVTVIDGKQYINYSGYNYLGLSGDAFVIEAVVEAVKKFGTSVSASRLVSGEKSLHRELEKAIADLIGVEDCLVLPSGYSTNITIITHLFGKGDLIIHDELSHNSIIQGALFSGAERMSFPHNQYHVVADFLEKHHQQYKKILIVTEGIFSMDGDIPDVKKLIALKKQYNAYLMIDEAHSMGVLGNTGRGIREHYDLNPNDVDLWMGTLSKTFASCGGYIAGTNELIENFKYTAAGFVYSAGMSPANTAAALAAITVMNQEPERIRAIKSRQSLLLAELKKRNIPTGLSCNTPIIPIVVGQDSSAIQLSHHLKEHRILALPIIYPAVQKNMARVRLFVNCLHTEDQIYKTVHVLQDAMSAINQRRNKKSKECIKEPE